MNHLKRFFLAIFFLSVTVAFGQAGSIDTNFNAEGFLHHNCGYGTVGMVKDVIQHDNGTIYFCTSPGSDYNCKDGTSLIRIDQAGNNMYSYPITIVQNILTMAVQGDGKILLGGTYQSGYPALGRMFEDGMPDETFDPGSGVGIGGTIQEIIVQPDGKIIIAGVFTSYNGVARKNIARLNSDGSLDLTFDPGSGPNSGITSIALQPDGKVLVAGNFTTFNGITYNRLVRLDTTGQLDSAFLNGSGYNGIVKKIILQDDGKIVACGNFTFYNNVDSRCVNRINTDGSLDASFNVGTPFSWEYNASSVSLTTDQKIIVTGTFPVFNGEDHPLIVKLNSDGTIDDSFYSTLDATEEYLGASIASDGKIIVFGNFENYRTSNNIARLSPLGELDLTFNARFGTDDDVLTSCTQPDGKILIGGAFTSYNQVKTDKMARLNSDGTIDNNFIPPTIANGNVLTIAIQSDGKILAGGEFTGFSGSSIDHIVRRNADGSADPTFTMTAGFNDIVNKIVVQPDQKILVGGSFTELDGISCVLLTRLNTDGSRDNTFNPIFNNGASVYDILIQEDGKILVAGSFNNVNGQGAFNLVRLNANGTNDPTFISPTPPLPDEIELIRRQSDGKILAVMGYQIVRFNGDGTPDNSFGTIGFNNPVYDICIQADDKIIVGGSFTSEGPNMNHHITRMMPDGSHDLSMHVGYSDWAVYHIAVQPDGKLLVGGGFNEYQDTVVNGVFRMITDAEPPNTLSVSVDSLSDVNCDTDGFLSLQVNGGTTPYSYEWQMIPVQTTADITFDTAGIYMCTVTDALGLTRSISILASAPAAANGFDMKSFMISANDFRPGFPASIALDGFNDGCIPVTGQLKLAIDPLIDFLSADPTPDAISDDTLIWNFTDLTYDSVHVTPQIEFNTPETAAIGDTVHFTLIMTPISGDTDTTNNVKHYAFPVVNGYDPNDKAVYPVGKCDIGYIVPDQLLTYTIRFQNTGNSEAINIAVVDSLDTDLDLNSIHVIGKSHDMWTEVLPGNVLKFHFDNIHLADSTSNESESHGYVIFEAKPMAGLAHNTNISNKVAIYFDYNPAVVTNTVANTIYDAGNFEDYNCAAAGIGENDNLSLILFPNPTNGNVTIQSEKLNGASLTLMDLQGKTILQKSVVNVSETELDLEDLESGIYLLNVQAADKTFTTVRVVKQ